MTGFEKMAEEFIADMEAAGVTVTTTAKAMLNDGSSVLLNEEDEEEETPTDFEVMGMTADAIMEHSKESGEIAENKEGMAFTRRFVSDAEYSELKLLLLGLTRELQEVKRSLPSSSSKQ